MTDSIFIHSAEIAWEKTSDGVRRQVLGHGTDLMVVRVEFEQGAVGALHSHPHRQATYVVAGKFEVTVGDDVKALGTGDVFYPPAGVTHGVTALEGGVLIDVFTPVRADFLAPVH